MSAATEADVRFYALMVCAVAAAPHKFALVFMVMGLLTLLRNIREERRKRIKPTGDST